MKRRRGPSLEDLSATIAAIHEAGARESDWLPALERIGRLFDGRMPSVWMLDSSGGFRDLQMLPHFEEVTRDYVEHYHHLDMVRPFTMRAPAGTVLTNEMVWPWAEYARTEFYAGYADAHDLHGCMQARVLATPGCSGYVALARSKRVGSFDREDVRLLGLLLPHLSRAMQTQLRLASADVRLDSTLEALDRLSHGVLMVDDQARVLYANTVAEAILREGDGLAVEAAGKRLRATTSALTSALHRAVAQAAGQPGAGPGRSGAALRLDRARAASLLLSISPVRAEAAWNVSPRPAALILVSATDAQGPTVSSPLQRLYGLTAAEAAVAEAIADGQGTVGAADALRVAPSTVRWHLQRAFEKTKATNQAKLVRLVERVRLINTDSDPKL